MGRLRRIVALAAVVVVAFALVPAGGAWACSCAEPTLDDLLEREPDAAVVRIRRIDADGGTSGVGYVEEVLHGPQLPEQLPLALDDGASCRPWVAVGDVAVLTFVPDGNGWRTLECGRMDPTTGLEPVTVDPSASGPASVVVAGRFPGAELIALDDQLRILTVGVLDGIRHGIRACGDDLLVPTGGPDGETSLALVGMQDLGTIGERLLTDDPEREVQVLDSSCGEGHVDVLTATWGATREIHLRQDVFGEDLHIALPSAEDAAFVGDDVLLLRQRPSAGGADLVRHDLDTETQRSLVALDGANGYEVSVAPDGGHALIRGFDEDPLVVLVDLDAEREIARSTGWWQPVGRPWLRNDRILQIDENAGGIGDADGLAEYRIVDLDLAAVLALEPTPSRNASAGNGMFLEVDGDSLAVTEVTGDPVRSTTRLWAAGVHDAVLLGAVAPADDRAVAELPAVDPAVARAARIDSVSAAAGTAATMFGPLVGITVAALGSVAIAGALLFRRRRNGA